MTMKKRSLVIQYNSPVVLNFAIISLCVLALDVFTSGWSTTKFFSVYASSPTDPFAYIRLFGHVLGHAGYAHFISNMTLFLVVGPPLEEKYGSRRLLFAIVITALVSGLVQVFFFPTTALLGASGLVFMMIVLSSLAGARNGGIPLTLILVIIIYLGGEIMDAFTQKDNISQLTHIVGGLCGAFLGLFAMGGKGHR